MAQSIDHSKEAFQRDASFDENGLRERMAQERFGSRYQSLCGEDQAIVDAWVDFEMGRI